MRIVSPVSSPLFARKEPKRLAAVHNGQSLASALVAHLSMLLFSTLSACVSDSGDRSPMESANSRSFFSDAIAGFEFCCKGIGTYEAYGFTQVEGAFATLNGGHFARDIQGAVGERVFSSAGNGFASANASIDLPIGRGAVGSITSPAFIIDRDFINFLIGGGDNPFESPGATAVVLWVDGKARRSSSGGNLHKSLRSVSWDVSEFHGQRATIQFIDANDGSFGQRGLGYLLTDDFRLADSPSTTIPQATLFPHQPGLLPTNPSGVGSSDETIADFEQCCLTNGFAHSGWSDVQGDFIRLTGGLDKGNINGVNGQRLFSSYGSGSEAVEGSAAIGDEATGSMTSPDFIIDRDFIFFAIGGGSNSIGSSTATAIALTVNGRTVRAASGEDKGGQLRLAAWDVSEYTGKNAKITIVDSHKGTGSDGVLPYILVDNLIKSNTLPAGYELLSSRLPPAETAGHTPLFSSPIPNRGGARIAGFEFCCGGGNGNIFTAHGFTEATGDFSRLDGGQWASDIVGSVGERAFSSAGTIINESGEEDRLGAEATGRLTTPPFAIRHRFINFLVGGGASPYNSPNATAVLLRVGNRTVRANSGSNEANTLRVVSWDVEDFAGRTAVISIVDHHRGDSADGSIGYIIADEFLASDVAQSSAPISTLTKPDTGPEGLPLLRNSSLGISDSQLSSFEFSCLVENCFANVGFGLATGDLEFLAGGLKDNNILPAFGDFVFASHGPWIEDSTGTIGSAATGEVDSDAFTIERDYINFYIAGGSNYVFSEYATSISVYAGSQLYRSSSGDNSMVLKPVSWYVEGIKGREATITIIDRHDGVVGDGNLPFIILDDLRASDQPIASPQMELPARVDDPGRPLFVSPLDGQENLHVAGFEFCCGKFDTYRDHGFTTSGTLDQLDGGQWVVDNPDFANAHKERIFSSAGASAPDENSPIVPIGFEATGTLTTPSFEISRPFINFLVGGGPNPHGTTRATSVTLLINDKVVRASSGMGDNTLRRVAWNVASYDEEQAMIRITDQHDNTGGDGRLPYILADDFRSSEEPNSAEIQDALPEVADDTPLFSSRITNQSNIHIASFEFCCRKLNTYPEHNFTSTGELSQLDGGFWAIGDPGIEGAVGERIFSSAGDGAPDKTSEVRQLGPAATGTITSPSFIISKPYINFLVGGGSSPYGSDKPTAVVLRVGGRVVRATSGNEQHMSIEPATWDVSEFDGRAATVEFIDQHDNTGGTGRLAFIMADDFKASDVAATQAQTALPPPPQEDEGKPLFTSAVRGQENIKVAGFEFCCRGYQTYPDHGFTSVTGDFIKLNGGQWALSSPAIEGAMGERIFSSAGDGASAQGADIEQLGPAATGSMNSPPFTINKRFINFLIGGGSGSYGSSDATAVALHIDGRVVRASSGSGTPNSLAAVSWDVSEFGGERASIEFVDQHDGSAGRDTLPFLLADEFRAADTATAAIETTAPTISLAAPTLPSTDGIPLTSDEIGIASMLILPSAQAPADLTSSQLINHGQVRHAILTDTGKNNIEAPSLRPATDYTVWIVVSDFAGNTSAIASRRFTTPGAQATVNSHAPSTVGSKADNPFSN